MTARVHGVAAALACATVRDGNISVKDLNELEYGRGEIYANVWHTDRIARISPQSGRVTGWIDQADLMRFARAEPLG